MHSTPLSELLEAHATLVSRLGEWRADLWIYKDDLRSTYWYGIMSKSVALVEVIVSATSRALLAKHDPKQRTLGQWIRIVASAPLLHPESMADRQELMRVLEQLLAGRNAFVHQSFDVPGAAFALDFLALTEALLQCRTVAQVVEVARTAA